MKAITIHQPWASCIALGSKRIENRTWAPPSSLIGERIAIHSSRQYDEVASMRLEHDKLIDVEIASHAALHRGCIVAVATLRGWVDARKPGATVWTPVSLERELTGDEKAAQRVWWAGPVGWWLGDVQPLKRPISCRGYQGLWPVSDELYTEIEERLAGTEQPPGQIYPGVKGGRVPGTGGRR